ncbi:unnamed protein product [Schistosoma haematobium]|nr:unnamed protein product [Schistosoma haematobium]
MIQSNEQIFNMFAMITIFASVHSVDGQYEPAYLKTNMVGSDTNTKTFRVIQEQTAALAFEWEPMKHDNFGYVKLHENVFLLSASVKVSKGNIGLLEAIGKPCEVSNYRADGHDNGYIFTEFKTYGMTYKRVPRIKNVQIQLISNAYPHVKWERERSACESSDSVIIFSGYSTQPLQMFIISSDQVEYHMKELQTKNGMELVFIVFNKHGNRFSLPTMAKYKTPLGKVIKEQPTIETIAVNVTVPDEVTTTLMTLSNNTHSTVLENISNSYVFIATLILIIVLVSIVSFFLIKKL